MQRLFCVIWKTISNAYVGWVEWNETQRFSNIITTSQARKYALFVGRPLGRKKWEKEFHHRELRGASRSTEVKGISVGAKLASVRGL